VPEGDLLNLNEADGQITVASKKKEAKRKTGFTKGPGGAGPGVRRRKPMQRSDSGDSAQVTEEENYEQSTSQDLTLVSGSTNSGDAGEAEDDDSDEEWEEEEWVPDVFLFEYGTVVIWGMTEKEEKSFLRSL
jgi:uncharacterized Rmd1/YagE family protein